MIFSWFGINRIRCSMFASVRSSGQCTDRLVDTKRACARKPDARPKSNQTTSQYIHETQVDSLLDT